MSRTLSTSASSRNKSSHQHELHSTVDHSRGQSRYMATTPSASGNTRQTVSFELSKQTVVLSDDSFVERLASTDGSIPPAIALEFAGGTVPSCALVPVYDRSIFISHRKPSWRILLQILSLPDPAVTQNPASEPTLPFSTTLSRLQCLDFNDRQWKRQQGNQVYISDVFTMFARFDFSSLDTVNFRRVYWSKGDDGSTPLFPFLIKHLRIWTMSQYLMDSIALSSSFPSGLETFDFVSLALEGTIDLTPCKTHHGGRLQKLELTINEHPKRDRLQLSEYTTTLPDVKIVLEGLQSYPLLTSLILSGTHGPSLRLLSTLAKSSPLLRNLDLSESRWISDSHPLSTVPDDIFPETRVLAELEQFKHIEHVHLGLLPTIDQNRYGTLVESLELRGVKVRFDCCVEDEESESE